MAKLSGTDLPGFEAQLKTTNMYYLPKDAAAFMTGADLPKIMDLVRTFCFEHNLLLAQVLEAMHHVRFLVNHIAAHGRAEEHVVYPYITTFMSGSDLELAALRADHVRLEELGRAIIEWTPAHKRAALHGLLAEFLAISEAHFLVEGEDCMRIVHGHVLNSTEQILFEAIEIETFDRVVDDAPGLVAR